MPVLLNVIDTQLV